MEQESDEYAGSYFYDGPLMSEDPMILQEEPTEPEEVITQNLANTFLANNEDTQQETQPHPEAPAQPQNSPQKKPESDVILNISGTKYKVVREVGGDLFQWNLSTDPLIDWDVAWVDVTLDSIGFSRLRPYQTINFFPGIQCIARKDQLSTNLKRLKRRYHENYNFFPDTFILPSEYNELRVQFMKDRKNKKIFIMKPQSGCQGRGIFLTDNIKNISTTDKYVAQRYLSKPYLLDGLKFDLRIYVLLTSCNPLQIYLFEDGLARFATETYKSPEHNNLSDMFMHLTNYAINKDNPNFVFNNSANDSNVGHKRSIKALFKALEEKGHDVKHLWEEIKKIVIKTFISVQPNLKQNYKTHLFTRNRTDACFQVFGFDVIIDENFKPWLLEVNASPSFTTDTPLDKSIKERAISDALRIMNITAENRLNPRRKNKIDGEMEYRTAPRIGETQEGVWFGGYEKIFPLDDPNKYTEDYEMFLYEANHFWNLALGIHEKREKTRRPESKATTAQNFYPNRDSYKTRFESPTPELKSSNVTDRSDAQSRPGTGAGGKRKKQKILDTPVKFFDIRSPLVSPSNQSYFAKQAVPNYLSKKPPKQPVIAKREESNPTSVIIEPNTPNVQMPMSEKDTNCSTIHNYSIDQAYQTHQPTTTTKEYKQTRGLPPKPASRDLNTLFQKSAENFSKINTSANLDLKKEFKEYKKIANKKIQAQAETHNNTRVSASARESVNNGVLEKSVDMKRKRNLPRAPKNSFNCTVFIASTPQRFSVTEDGDTGKSELPKRFAQQIFKTKSFLENSPAQNTRDKDQSIIQKTSEKPKARSSMTAQRPSSSKTRTEAHNPIYSNLVTGKDTSYQHLTPKISNFIMPKLIESLSNLSLKKAGVASPGVSGTKENKLMPSESKIVGMRVSHQGTLNYMSQNYMSQSKA